MVWCSGWCGEVDGVVRQMVWGGGRCGEVMRGEVDGVVR